MIKRLETLAVSPNVWPSPPLRAFSVRRTARALWGLVETASGTTEPSDLKL